MCKDINDNTYGDHLSFEFNFRANNNNEYKLELW
jgi:hypothetical protein